MSPVDPAPSVPTPSATELTPAPAPRKAFKPTKTQLIVAGVGCLLFTGFFFLLLVVAAAVYFLRPGSAPSAPPAPLINIEPKINLPAVPRLPVPTPKPAPKLPPKPCLHPPFDMECPYCHGVFKVQPPPSNPKVSDVPSKVQDAATNTSRRLESHSWRGTVPGDCDPCRPDIRQPSDRPAGLPSFTAQGCRPPRFGPSSGEPA